MSKRKYKVKITPKLKKTLKYYWQRYKSVTDFYYKVLHDIEKDMEKETRIKGIEFFRSDDGICGIGNYGMWTMPLILREELED